MNLFKFKRGNVADQPTLALGEPSFDKDIMEANVGGDFGNVPLSPKLKNVKAWGVKGGVNDDTVNLQRAINNCRGGIFFPDDLTTVKITSPITLKPGIMIDFGNTIIDASAIEGNIFESEGSVVSIGSFTVDGSIDDVSITVDSTAGIQVGDYIRIRSENQVGSTNQKQAQYSRVASVTTFTIGLDSPLEYDFLVADTAGIDKMIFNEGFRIKGGRIKGTSDNTKLVTGIQLKYCKDILIEDVEFENTHYNGISLWGAYNSYVDKCRFKDILYAGLAYGVASVFNTEKVNVTRCYGTNLRHLTTTGGGTTDYGIPKDVVVDRCFAENCNDAGFDFHPSGRRMKITDCNVNGSPTDGIVCQAQSAIIKGCTIRNVGRHGILVQHLTQFPLSVIVEGNIIEGRVDSGAGDHGVSVALTDEYNLLESLSISNNEMTRFGGYGVNFAVGFTVIENKDIKIHDNTMKTNGAYSVYLRNLKGATVEGNTIRGNYSTTSVFLNLCDECIVSDNIIESYDPIGLVFTGSGIRVLDGDDNIIANNIVKANININIDAASNNNLVDGNNLRQFNTSAISDSSATTVTGSNVV